jgi:large subunit ribosomal protein L30e
MTVLQQIKEAKDNEKLVMGSREVFKGIKNEMIETVIYASNCPAETVKDLNHYGKVSKIKTEPFKNDSSKLGELCGKPFGVLVIGIRK